MDNTPTFESLDLQSLINYGEFLILIGPIILIIWLSYNYIKVNMMNITIRKEIDLRKYNFSKRKELLKEYRSVLLELNKCYTSVFDYIGVSHNRFLKCYYLTENQISSSYIDEYHEKIAYYSNDYMRIREESLERIEKCLINIYAIKSAVEYYDKHILYAKKTIESLYCRNHVFIKYFPKLYKKRLAFLKQVDQQCNRIKNDIEGKLPHYWEAIRKLSNIKKPDIFDFAINVLTAPIRHTFNLIDGLIENNTGKFQKNAMLLGLSFIGGSIIGDAIDILDTIDISDYFDVPSFDVNIDIDNPNMHHVDPYYRHNVDGSLSYVDGNPDPMIHDNNGWYQHNPDYKIKS